MESVEDAYPLNAAHRGILFHSLQCDEADDYLSVISVRIQGKLDQAALQRAWQQVLLHHSSLRSGVVVDGLEEPLWVVHESLEPVWDYHDLSALAPAEQDAQISAVVEKLKITRFEFAGEILMRFTLIQLGNNTHRLLWCIHHLVSDGWSTAIALDDAVRAYSATIKGNVATLSPTLAYGQFLSARANTNLESHKAYWSEVQLMRHNLKPSKQKFSLMYSSVNLLHKLRVDLKQPVMHCCWARGRSFCAIFVSMSVHCLE